MLSKELKKAFSLVKKTGDRLLVFDSNLPEESFIIIDIDSYEKLLTGEGRVEKEYKTENIVKVTDNLSKNEKNGENNEDPEDLTDEDLTDRINREISMWKNKEEVTFGDENNEVKKPWKISPKVKEKASEIE